MSLVNRLKGLLSEPPPPLAFEISEAGITAARLRPKGETTFHPLKPGSISVSPVRDNVLVPDDLAAAVRGAAGPNGTRKRRDAALILPDNCARVAVLDFDEFPSDRKEQISLVRFRLRRSLPFDVEEAAVSYYPQSAGGKKVDVVAAVAPHEIVSRYEAPFRNAGLNPGYVTVSSLAFLDLVPDKSLAVAVKLCGRTLTIMVLEKGRLKLLRCLQPGGAGLGDMIADLYPTLVFVEDQYGRRAEKLLLAGFEDRSEEARAQFHQDLGIDVEPVRTTAGLAGENNAGLLGYLRSVAQGN